MATTGTAVDVVMPQMGVSVSEGTITKWLKSEGEAIAADESLLEISTDKVDTEVPSPANGVLQQILAQEGETVAVGTKIAVIAPEGAEVEAEAPPEPPTQEAAQEAEAASGAEGEGPAAAKAAEAPEPEQEAAHEPPAAAPEAPAAPKAEDDNGRREAKFVSPVVARIAAEHNVDVGSVEGTGRGGRVTKKDILGYIESGQAGQAPAPAESPAEEAPSAPAPAAAPQAAPAAQVQEGETSEPMSAMRKGIAEHMRRSLDTSAHVTSSIEIDMTKIAALRQKLKKDWASSYGVNPTFLAFVARAVVDTLKDLAARQRVEHHLDVDGPLLQPQSPRDAGVEPRRRGPPAPRALRSRSRRPRPGAAGRRAPARNAPTRRRDPQQLGGDTLAVVEINGRAGP